MSKHTAKIIVNSLTSSRIFGAFFLPVVFKNVSIPGLIILLVFLFITDFLDGKLARLHKVQTVGGSILDPLGDKVLAIFCLIALIGKNQKLFILLIFELVISIINIIRVIRGDNVKSSIIGKAKTWLLSITLILGAISIFRPEILTDALRISHISEEILTIEAFIDATFYMAVGAETMTLIAYLIEAFKEKKSQKSINLKDLNLKVLVKRLFDEEKYLEDKDKSFKDLINTIEGE